MAPTGPTASKLDMKMPRIGYRMVGNLDMDEGVCLENGLEYLCVGVFYSFYVMGLDV